MKGYNMSKETITITLTDETLDLIRKQAHSEYRSINKHIAYLIAMGLKATSQKGALW